MSLHVIIGGGPVGSALSRLLADRGEQVRVITRSGSGPSQDGIRPIAADATDAAALAEHARGATALYNCAGPAYHRWATDWPPLGAAMIRAAEITGAVLVSTGNLYGYGPVNTPMTEDLPFRPTSIKGRVRADLWSAALAAHEAGRIRTTEVRGSDYLGAGTTSPFSVLVLPKVLAGRTASIPADLDAPHSWTQVADVANLLATVAAEEKAWGRPWHVPTAAPLSIRALAQRAAELAGAPHAQVRTMPGFLLRLAGLADPAAREMIEIQYQLRKPFVLDSSAATAAFGLEPLPVEAGLHQMITAARIPSPAPAGHRPR